MMTTHSDRGANCFVNVCLRDDDDVSTRDCERSICRHIIRSLNLPTAPRYTISPDPQGQLSMPRMVSAFDLHDAMRAMSRSSLHNEKERGFTLVELLVVLAILGLLIGLVAPAMMRQLGSAKHKIAEQSVERLGGILDLYRLDVGVYPTTEQGLAALNTDPAGVAGWNGPYMKDSNGVRDPWGRPFSYRNPSQRPGVSFDIVSLGADGRPGGGGEDADVINR
jgi:general secretion pathway protein G